MVEMPKGFVPDGATAVSEGRTFTGNRGLAIEEPLIFEIGSPETSGVDFEDPLILSFSPRGEGTPELSSVSEATPQPAPSPLGERAGVRGSFAAARQSTGFRINRAAVRRSAASRPCCASGRRRHVRWISIPAGLDQATPR
jgi:hypothetical protein